MKALVYTNPFEVTYRDEPDAKAGHGESIIEVEAVGICGSDMHAFQGHDARRNPPLILGHEVAGKVMAGELQGERVILNPLITCTYCDYCLTGRSNLCENRTMIGMTRPGGFADQVSIPDHCLVTIPYDMEAHKAALTEPAATSLHGLALVARVAARPLCEARALVIGGGSVGLLAALMLHDQGCEEIVLAETNKQRGETASATGVCEVVDPVNSDINENHFDVVVDAVGNGITRKLASSTIKPGGVLLHIGLTDNAEGLDMRKMTLAEVIVIGTYTYTTADLRATVKKLFSGALGSLDWVEQRSLASGAQAFDDLLNHRCAAPKIVLHP